MKQLTRRKERLLAAVIGLILVAIIVVALKAALIEGARFVDLFQGKTGKVDSLVGYGFLFFMISATDWPAKLRESDFIRVQMQCWAVWFFLLAAAFVTSSWAQASTINSILTALICGLGVYSFVGLFWPRDILRGWGPTETAE